MLYGEKLKSICEKLGVDAKALPDKLYSTLLNEIEQACENAGGGETPTGSISITENGTYDVKSYAEAVVNVESSGGGDTEQEDRLVARTLTTYSNDRVTSVGSYAFYYYKTLISVGMINVTSIGGYAFNECSGLTSANFPNVKSINSFVFQYCTNLTSVNVYLVESIGTYAFGKCTNLETIEFNLITSIGSNAFKYCSNLTKVIIRTPSVCTLSATNAFDSTPIASGTGYIYVPDELVEQYKVATNWVTYANQIKGLSELPTEE